MKRFSKIGIGFLFLMLLTESFNNGVFAQANPKGAFEFVSRIDASKDDALEMVLDGKLLFVANKAAGLSIVDISDIYNPRVVSRTPSVGQNYGIAKKGNFVFMADNLAGLMVYDVTNIKKPLRVAELALKGEAWDVKIKDNYAYIAAGLAGLVVVDITDPKAPKEVTSLRYDKDWDYARKVFISDKGLLFLADRKAGIHAINIDNPVAPKELRRFQTQFAVGIEVADNFAYVADGPNGMLVIDVSNPEKMRQVADFKLPGHTNNVAKVGPYVYASVDDAGIRAIDVSNPNKPQFDARYDTPGQAFSMVKYDIFMVVADLSSILFLTHNKPPVIYPTPDQVVAEGKKLEFKVRGMDPDGDAVGFTANFIPEGAVFNENDTLFSWTPTYEQSGKYEGIVLTVTEKTQTKLFSRDTVTITVIHTNRAPSLPLTGNYTVDENKELIFVINKPSDPDVEDDGKLKVSATGLPQGAIFDETTLTFKWIPTFEQSGVYTINFFVKDEAGLTDTKSSVITVNNINRPPVFADLAASFTTDENKPFTFNIQASDPDKEDAGKLEYAGFNLPAGATFDKGSQSFTWTPTYDQSGKYEGIYFIVKDAEGLSDTVYTSVTVNHVNRSPFFASIAAQQVDELKVLSFKLSASDADVEDEGKVTIKAAGIPEGATYQEATKTFTWTPTYEQSGDYTAVFKATDGAGATDELSVVVKVININRPPTIAAIQPQNVDENKELVIVIPEAVDPDKEDAGKLVYTVEGLPQGAAFDAASRTIKWTPTYEQSGVYEGIKVTVKDVLGLTASATFKITVKHINRPPVLDAIADQVVDEVKPLQFRVKGSDPDKEDAGKLVITAENLPAGATAQVYEGVMVFAWTPTYDQSGEYNVTFKITDPEKLVDSKVVKIAVTNINRIPKLAAIPAASGDENKPVKITLPEAEDLDKEDAGKLVYTVEGLPEGASFDAASRTINWTPTYDQSGNYSVKVTVTDVLGGKDTKTMDIRVNHVNRPPVMNEIAAQSVDEGQKLSFNADVSDPDKEDQNRLTMTAEGTPQGAVFNAQSRSFTWTPTFDQAGDYKVTFKVTDPAGLSDSKTITIKVKNVNRKPALGSLTNQKGSENQAMTFTVTATDPDKEDADKIKLSAEGLPDGASFSGGKFSWTPNYDQAGDYTVTFKAKDGEGLEDSKAVTISVSNVNRAPKLGSLSNQNGTEGQAITFSASASDDDKNDKLVFSMTGAPAGASMSVDGSFSWTPGVGQAGTYTITVKVSDGNLSDTKTCTITVEKAQ